MIGSWENQSTFQAGNVHRNVIDSVGQTRQNLTTSFFVFYRYVYCDVVVFCVCVVICCGTVYNKHNCGLRGLDADLGTIMKAAEPFEWQRINFVLEARIYL